MKKASQNIIIKLPNNQVYLFAICLVNYKNLVVKTPRLLRYYIKKLKSGTNGLKNVLWLRIYANKKRCQYNDKILVGRIPTPIKKPNKTIRRSKTDTNKTNTNKKTK